MLLSTDAQFQLTKKTIAECNVIVFHNVLIAQVDLHNDDLKKQYVVYIIYSVWYTRF